MFNSVVNCGDYIHVMLTDSSVEEGEVLEMGEGYLILGETWERCYSIVLAFENIAVIGKF